MCRTVEVHRVEGTFGIADLCVWGERYREVQRAEVQGRGRVQRVEGTFCVCV